MTLDARTGPWNLVGATITGGNIISDHNNPLSAGFHSGGTLVGVTLHGLLDLTLGTDTTITNGLSLDQGQIALQGSTALSFQGSQTLGGSGDVSLTGMFATNGLSVPIGGSTLTIGPNVLIHGNSGFVGGLNGGTFTNQGTIAAENGGTLISSGATNFSAGTLTGGTWQATAGSTLRLTGANVATNSAEILLDGANSHIYSDGNSTSALANLSTIAATGRLTIQNGSNLATSGPLNNLGSLSVGTGSTFTAAGDYTSVGSTVVDGVLHTTTKVTIGAAGVLSGSGTVTANVVNDGVLSPGDSPGTLTINGAYTQDSTGILNLEIGGTTAGTQYDQLHVSGLATLAGTGNVSLVNGFGSTTGQTFQVISFGSLNGTFTTINGLGNGRFQWFGAAYSPTSLTLTAESTTADLAFDSFDSGTFPTSALAGQSVNIRYTVRNQSTTPAMGDWYDSLYITAQPGSGYQRPVAGARTPQRRRGRFKGLQRNADGADSQPCRRRLPHHCRGRQPRTGAGY